MTDAYSKSARIKTQLLHILAQGDTGPVQAILYAETLIWLVFLALTPDRAYAHSIAWRLLSVKAVWVAPALVKALITPITWYPQPRQARLVAQLYCFAWWCFLALSLLIIAPGILPFWAPVAGNAAASFWILARQGADEIVNAAGG